MPTSKIPTPPQHHLAVFLVPVLIFILLLVPLDPLRSALPVEDSAAQAPPSGDWNFSGVSSYSNLTIEINGNLSLLPGSSLELRYCAVVFVGPFDSFIEISSGGKLILDSCSLKATGSYTVKITVIGEAVIQGCDFRQEKIVEYRPGSSGAFERNRMLASADKGLVVSSPGIRITGNEISNKFSGMELDSSCNASGNVLRANDFGMVAEGPCRLVGNWITSSRRTGFLLSGPECSLESNILDLNPIGIDSSGGALRLENNLLRSNSEGIRISSGTLYLHGNLYSSNGDAVVLYNTRVAGDNETFSGCNYCVKSFDSNLVALDGSTFSSSTSSAFYLMNSTMNLTDCKITGTAGAVVASFSRIYLSRTSYPNEKVHLRDSELIILSPSVDSLEVSMSLPRVIPGAGAEGTTFTFTVTFKDSLNRPPSSVRVLLDGEPFEMVQADVNDTDFRDGKDYIRRIDLKMGTHLYSFKCTDVSGATVTAAGGALVVSEPAPWIPITWHVDLAVLMTLFLVPALWFAYQMRKLAQTMDKTIARMDKRDEALGGPVPDHDRSVEVSASERQPEELEPELESESELEPAKQPVRESTKESVKESAMPPLKQQIKQKKKSP